MPKTPESRTVDINPQSSPRKPAAVTESSPREQRVPIAPEADGASRDNQEQRDGRLASVRGPSLAAAPSCSVPESPQ